MDSARIRQNPSLGCSSELCATLTAPTRRDCDLGTTFEIASHSGVAIRAQSLGFYSDFSPRISYAVGIVRTTSTACEIHGGESL